MLLTVMDELDLPRYHTMVPLHILIQAQFSQGQTPQGANHDSDDHLCGCADAHLDSHLDDHLDG